MLSRYTLMGFLIAVPLILLIVALVVLGWQPYSLDLIGLICGVSLLIAAFCVIDELAYRGRMSYRRVFMLYWAILAAFGVVMMAWLVMWVGGNRFSLVEVVLKPLLTEAVLIGIYFGSLRLTSGMSPKQFAAYLDETRRRTAQGISDQRRAEE